MAGAPRRGRRAGAALAAEAGAAVTAKEVRASGAHQNYSPTCDVARDPRWGRTFETFGESPYLCGKFAAAKVRGYQGDGIEDSSSVVAPVSARYSVAHSDSRRRRGVVRFTGDTPVCD